MESREHCERLTRARVHRGRPRRRSEDDDRAAQGRHVRHPHVPATGVPRREVDVADCEKGRNRRNTRNACESRRSLGPNLLLVLWLQAEPRAAREVFRYWNNVIATNNPTPAMKVGSTANDRLK